MASQAVTAVAICPVVSSRAMAFDRRHPLCAMRGYFGRFRIKRVTTRSGHPRNAGWRHVLAGSGRSVRCYLHPHPNDCGHLIGEVERIESVVRFGIPIGQVAQPLLLDEHATARQQICQPRDDLVLQRQQCLVVGAGNSAATGSPSVRRYVPSSTGSPVYKSVPSDGPIRLWSGMRTAQGLPDRINGYTNHSLTAAAALRHPLVTNIIRVHE